MWARFMRLIRSFFGLFIRGLEDPKLLLQQAMDDMKSKIPQMNEQAAGVIKAQKMIEMDAERTALSIANLEKQVEMAVRGGEGTHNAALTLIGQLGIQKAHMAELSQHLEAAKANSRRILDMRAAFEQKIQRQIEECRTQLSRADMAEAEDTMASITASFKVGDVSDTLDNARGVIDEKLAKARARMEVAGETTEAQLATVELQTQTATADATYRELQIQYGLVEAPAGERTMEPIPLTTTTPAEKEKQATTGTTQTG